MAKQGAATGGLVLMLQLMLRLGFLVPWIFGGPHTRSESPLLQGVESKKSYHYEQLRPSQ